MSPKEATDQMKASCEATRDLYLFMLALPQALTKLASERIEAARSKFNPTEQEKNPNLKFVRNGVVPLLEQDPDLQKILEKKKLSWDQYDVFLFNLLETIKASDYYQKYMEEPSCDLKQDADLFVKIFENELEDNEELAAILEDMNVWWNDDLGYALGWDCRAINDLAKGRRWSMPELYSSQMSQGKDDDKAFVSKVISAAMAGYDAYVEQIAQCTHKWDSNRICATDLALIVCGMAEAKACPATSPKIIINEYVEISKYYSTPESRSFVNGILDKLLNNK